MVSNYRHNISEFTWNKNGAQSKSNSRLKNIQTDDNDLYLKGFLIGYRREINRRIELIIRENEKKNKEHDVNFSLTQLRRTISDIVENEVDNKIDVMKREIESMRKDKIRLKHEIDDLITKHEELKRNVKENIEVMVKEGQNNKKRRL